MAILAQPQSLKEIRESFVTLSGRYNLVTDTETFDDNGANFFIEEGRKFLDAIQDQPRTEKWYKADITAGQFFIKIESLRAIREVYIVDSDERIRLDERTSGWLRTYYREPFSQIDQGTPEFYAIVSTDLSPEKKGLTAADFSFGDEALIYSSETDRYKKTGIVITPPPDQTWTIEVLGIFGSMPLISDTDKNFWTVNYPSVLIQAALYMVEMFHRNTEGMKDALAAMEPFLMGIDKDLATDGQTFNQIGG